MKVKLLIGALIFLIVLNLATIGSFVYTQWKRGQYDVAPAPVPHRPPRADRPDQEFPRRAMRLDAAERAELVRLLREFMEETAEQRTRITALEEQAFERMQRTPVPRAELDSLLAEIEKTRLDISRKATDKLIEAKTHLSPEQLEHFYQRILTSRPGHREGHHGRRFEGGGSRGANKGESSGQRI